MKEPAVHDTDLLEASLNDLSTGDEIALKSRLDELRAGEIADLIESVPEPEREKVWGLVPEEAAGDVLYELGEKARTALAEDLPAEQVIAAAGTMEPSDLAEVIDELPPKAPWDGSCARMWRLSRLRSPLTRCCRSCAGVKRCPSRRMD